VTESSLLAAQTELEGVLNDVILLCELVAVHREYSPRGIVEQAKQVNAPLGFFDFPIELLAVIADGD
jgi:hypothetical protein